MSKTILAYVCESAGGGVRRHLIDLLENINKEKYDIHVLYGVERADTVFLAAAQRMKDVHFYPVAEMKREVRIKRDAAALIKIMKIFKRIKPDIVHCCSSKAGALGRVAAKLLHIRKVFYTPHCYIIQNPNISKKEKRTFRLIEKILGAGFTQKTIHVSKGEERVALQNRLIKREKSAVVYNGVARPNEPPQKKDAKSGLKIVTIARFDEQKNPWDAIKIIEALIKYHQEIKFTYVGDGKYLNEIADYIKNHNLEYYIKLTGFMANPYAVLQDADIFLTTSLYEGLPYSLIEAMAFGLPIVGTNVTGNNELIVDGYNGFLFDVGRIDEACVKLNSLLNDRGKLVNMSSNAYQRYLKHFTLGKMLMSYEQLYSSEFITNEAEEPSLNLPPIVQEKPTSH